MSGNRTAAPRLAAAGLALLTACGGDPIAPAGDPLSEAEAAAIAQFMTGSAFEGLEFDGGEGPSASIAPAPSARGSSEPVEFDVSVEVTGGCPLGGSISVSGAYQGFIDSETESGTLTLDVDVSADACGFPAEETTFTVDTNPNLALDGNFEWAAGQPVGEQTFSYVGTVLWSADDGRSGSCAFDLQVTRSENGSLVESGTSCGTSIDEL